MSEPEADPNIKTIRLVGGPTTGGEGKTRKRGGGGGSQRKTFKVGIVAEKEGGGSTSPGTLVQLESSRVPGPPSEHALNPVGVNSPLTAVGTPLETQSAGKKDMPKDMPMKVVLTAAKKKKGAVVLAEPKKKVGDSKTRKVSKTKKVRVTISNLGKKIHKAKEIRKAATDTSIEEIKNELQKAALIKGGSKAPDAMLRQLYADFMMLKGRAL
jgi:hypothetical protein